MTPPSAGAVRRFGVTPLRARAERAGCCGHDEGKHGARRRRRSNRPWRCGPSDGNAFADLGSVYLRQDRVDDAQKALQRALALDPTLPLANNTMGLTALRKGMVGVAETHFREAIRLQPDLAEAHNNLGNLLAGRHAYAEAAYHFEKAIASNPRMWRRATAMDVTSRPGGFVFEGCRRSWKRWSSWRRDWQRCVSISPTCWRRWGDWTRLARSSTARGEERRCGGAGGRARRLADLERPRR